MAEKFAEIAVGASPNTGRTTINSNFADVYNLGNHMIGPNNKLIFDKNGIPSFMVFIPRFNWDPSNGFNSSTVHPAFVVNGVTKPGFWVSKYQCVLVDSAGTIYDTGSNPGGSHTYMARSIPGVKPRTYIDFDAARLACANMNNGSTITGWHLMTNAEWAAIALWCKNNTLQPLGNNNYGRDVDNKSVVGEIVSGDTFGSGTSRWKTGTGGCKTTHDGSFCGIYDLNGNIWEWIDGVKIVEGKVYVCGNLNSSPTTGGNSFAAVEANWYDTGLYINWDGVNDYFTFSNTNRGTSLSPSSKSLYFGDVTGDTSDLIKALALYPLSGGSSAYNFDYFYAANYSEILAIRGGNFSNSTRAGIFTINATNVRSVDSGAIGFRAAYIE